MAFNTTFVSADAYNVTPADAVSQPGVSLYVGGAGNVTLITQKGTTVLFSGCPAGLIIPIAFGFVKATGTTATNLVAFQP